MSDVRCLVLVHGSWLKVHELWFMVHGETEVRGRKAEGRSKM